MTGKAYYITTLAAWQRHAPRFANSHFILLDAGAGDAVIPPVLSAAEGNPAPTLSVGDGGEGSAVARGVPELASAESSVEAPDFSPAKTAGAERLSFAQPHPQHVVEPSSGADDPQSNGAEFAPAGENARILVLIEADEGVHLSLEDDSVFELLPHPLAQTPISAAAQSALAPHGVSPGATTFDAAEALARIHPLLKHRVF